jgi:DNA polymerase-3 subunit gamma/tau
MSYIVLARKLRPKTLDEVIGQPLIVQALRNALSLNKLHPAYLLTGTHGTGKTTLGRLIAKALNCQNGPFPCLKCDSCEMIQAGTHPDLCEIDAASRTKVEDTRSVLEHVQYLPVMGKKKVYLIDEVHMLSQHSFNALLKTLEEPPSHVQFILATTEPNKIPKTILSRCLHFNLQLISEEKITTYLSSILDKEKINYEHEALSHIAKSAKGSMRDALSLLDQLLAISPDNISNEVTSTLLSTLPVEKIDTLLSYIANKDIDQIQNSISEFEKNNIDFRNMLSQLSERIVQISIHKLQGRTTPLTTLWTDSYLQVLYRMLMQGISDLDHSPSLSLGSLMCLIRMAVFYPEERTENSQNTPKVPKKNDFLDFSLTELISKLSLTPMLTELLSHSSLHKDEDKWTFTISPSHQYLINPKTTEKLKSVLEKTLNTSIQVLFKIKPTENTPYQEKQQEKAVATEKAKTALDQDPVLKSLLSELDVTKENVTIHPSE